MPTEPTTAPAADSLPRAVLHSSTLAPGKDVPLGLTGYPTEIEGQPVAYRRKEIARAGKWTHRGEKNPDGTPLQFEITRDRMDRWVQAFGQRLSNGIKPRIPLGHRDADPRNNQGYVVGLERQGDSLYGTMQLIGDEALKVAASNDVSIGVVGGAVDAYGNSYGEALDHLALVPDPALPHLGPYLKIAASANGPAVDVPVFEMSPTPHAGQTAPARSPDMPTPEQTAALQKVLAAMEVKHEPITDANFADLCLSATDHSFKIANAANAAAEEAALNLSAATKERDEAKAAAEAKQQEVLTLSATAPKRPDPVTLSMYGDNVAAKRENAIAKGLTEHAAKRFDALLADAQGLPTTLALSACGAKQRPLAFEVWDALAEVAAAGSGIAARPGVTRAAEMNLSAGEGEQPKTDAEKEAAKKKMRDLYALPARS